MQPSVDRCEDVGVGGDLREAVEQFGRSPHLRDAAFFSGGEGASGQQCEGRVCGEEHEVGDRGDAGEGALGCPCRRLRRCSRVSFLVALADLGGGESGARRDGLRDRRCGRAVRAQQRERDQGVDCGPLTGACCRSGGIDVDRPPQSPRFGQGQARQHPIDGCRLEQGVGGIEEIVPGDVLAHAARVEELGELRVGGGGQPHGERTGVRAHVTGASRRAPFARNSSRAER